MKTTERPENVTLFLRRANEGNIRILYEWANDPVTRKNSFSMAKIPYSDHCQWFSDIFKSEKRIQYILCKSNSVDEMRLGQIRIDIDENSTAEISYSIAPEYRRCGYGKQALILIQDEIKKTFPFIKKLIGKVKAENMPSGRAFLKSGYHEAFTQYEIDL